MYNNIFHKSGTILAA